MNKEQLMPCPLCNSEVILDFDHHIECTECGLIFTHCSDDNETIKAWNTRTESKPIQVSEPVNIEGEYWDAKQVIENPKDYHKQTVYDAGNFIRGYELALSQQPEVSQEYFDKIHSILDDSEGWVSVDDRLPEINKPVLIFAKYGKQATARRTGELWIDLMRTQHSYGSITHWQPLPNPPKE